MKQRLVFLLKYLLFWLFLFFVVRILFYVYNVGSWQTASFGNIAKSFFYGLRMDVSMASYIAALSNVILALLVFVDSAILKRIFQVLTFLLVPLFVLMIVSDVEVYRNWGYKMDGSVLLYVATPKEAVASIMLWHLALLIFLVAVLSAGFYYIYLKYVQAQFVKFKNMHWGMHIGLFAMLAIWFVPMRGGVGIAPLNTGSVYFCKESFANHGAVNTVWNFMRTSLKMGKVKVPHFMENNQAQQITELMLRDTVAVPYPQLLKVKKPNIVLLILESFTSKIIAPLGGEKNVTPQFNQLCKEGILFSNCYASNDRSDKGLVALLSGYPALPNSSIIKFSNKTEKIPKLSKMLNAEGYNSAFYYGGDIEFANMKSYLISSEFDEIISKDFFPHELHNTKWGVHDEYVFDTLMHHLNRSIQPFFKAYFTLSNHEPFDVPYQSKFKGSQEWMKFFNSANYTDSCLGVFVEKAKQQPWWDSTLIVLVADHGNRMPYGAQVHQANRFTIPLLFIGGAVAKNDTVIDAYVSQIDIPAMICRQIGLPTDKFTFSKDPLQMAKSFAIYTYNNGFAYLDNTETYIFDLTSNKEVEVKNSDGKKGKAYVQTLMSDFMKK